ncbi:DUF1810 domain-containing protein [Novosphingobium mangrovi (ex Huang et al. 2023)]|uniref:DUF1810 domain-containing protein n=1 Tax=Novosphingobium mangrovi (ex Huang et al. 2023) TaxID=2976432 RepID=A0ABT2HZP3_9SPHN|nr:DUF1810 domain-containing protein [Novosphingobium mangrovi (ex Huang et al. 2023)]MCT2398024.1 DUF1810 domain-containing protein [Novosphingobium mangrovi (ex Huang et al. 2023)]
MPGLDRFVDAQRDTYAAALDEIGAGTKRSHWMWFVFPQIAGLGRSPTAQYYAIADLGEARAYLAHPVLGRRLAECTDRMLDWGGKRSAASILGGIDALKFRSSMTLFEAAARDPAQGARFARALDAFCQSHRDERTLQRLDSADG